MIQALSNHRNISRIQLVGNQLSRVPHELHSSVHLKIRLQLFANLCQSDSDCNHFKLDWDFFVVRLPLTSNTYNHLLIESGCPEVEGVISSESGQLAA